MYILASIFLVVAAAFIFLTWPAPTPHETPASMQTSDLEAARVDPIAAVKEQIENKHPATYFVLAQRLFALGARDEAVFWFYVGLIRYRGYLTGAHDAGEAERFHSLWEAVERPINDHAFGDVAALAAAIGRALAWDEMRTDPYTAKPGARDQVRIGLRRMRLELLARRDAFRAARAGAAPGAVPYG
jgi:hypothetical protein